MHAHRSTHCQDRGHHRGRRPHPLRPGRRQHPPAGGPALDHPGRRHGRHPRLRPGLGGHQDGHGLLDHPQQRRRARSGAAQTLAPGADCGIDQGAAASRFLTVEGTTRTELHRRHGVLPERVDRGEGEEERDVVLPGQRAHDRAAAAAPRPAGAGLVGSTAVASSAFLDLELKQSARILATPRWPAPPRPPTSCRAAPPSGLPPLTGTTPFTCNNPADSGPDSGVNDNCRWPISAPSWTAGGDDGDLLRHAHAQGGRTVRSRSRAAATEPCCPQSPTTTPNASVLEIVEGTIDCGGQTRTEAASGDQPQVTVSPSGQRRHHVVRRRALRTGERAQPRHSSSSRSTARPARSSCGTSCGGSTSRPARRRCRS